jgi:hypothetical protein
VILLNPYRFAAAGGGSANVKLLCHFDGTNGQTTTVDSSPVGRTLTMAGTTPQLSTAQAKFGTASFDASSNASTRRVTALNHADWIFGAGQFTVEAFVRFTSAPGAGTLFIVSCWWGGGNGQSFALTHIGGALRFYYSTDGTNNPNVGATWTPTLNQWYHIAADRDASNVLRVYIDGAVHASATVASTFYSSTGALEVGANNSFSGITGYLDEVRITKGTAWYGGAFTPPSAPF